VVVEPDAQFHELYTDVVALHAANVAYAVVPASDGFYRAQRA